MNNNEAREYLLYVRQQEQEQKTLDPKLISEWNERKMIPVDLDLSGIDLSGLWL